MTSISSNYLGAPSVVREGPIVATKATLLRERTKESWRGPRPFAGGKEERT
ncbi:hypothetical protein [Psychromicrobium sp. YIM B11713]|uniref:hypothetical protein n=1 Tax=Psychromicrobium sp. YIM B11713 TaxID=3145233 RepID=UPI00374ED57A